MGGASSLRLRDVDEAVALRLAELPVVDALARLHAFSARTDLKQLKRPAAALMHELSARTHASGKGERAAGASAGQGAEALEAAAAASSRAAAAATAAAACAAAAASGSSQCAFSTATTAAAAPPRRALVSTTAPPGLVAPPGLLLQPFDARSTADASVRQMAHQLAQQQQTVAALTAQVALLQQSQTPMPMPVPMPPLQQQQQQQHCNGCCRPRARRSDAGFPRNTY